MIAIADCIPWLEQALKIFERLKTRKEEGTQIKDNAAKAFRTAVVETNLYITLVRNDNKRQFSQEAQLAHTWMDVVGLIKKDMEFNHSNKLRELKDDCEKMSMAFAKGKDIVGAPERLEAATDALFEKGRDEDYAMTVKPAKKNLIQDIDLRPPYKHS